MPKRQTNFTFTWNNYPPTHQQTLLDIKGYKYIAYSKEVAPTTNTPHLQGLIVMSTKKSLAQLIKLLPGVHLELMYSNIANNITYCSKSAELVEIGKRPMTQKEKGQSNIDRYKKAWELAKAGKVEDIDADIRMKSYSTIKRIQRDYVTQPKDLDWHLPPNLWIQGPPGCGKSRWARENYPGAYMKNAATEWWDGYQGEDTVIIDDLDKYHLKQGYNLKIWLDRYAFPAQVKGYTIFIRPKTIIITSNYSMAEIWDDPITVTALQRRCTTKPMYAPLALRDESK